MRRIVALTGALCFLLAAPALAAPAAGRWTGKLDEYTSKLHFSVAGGRVSNFTVTNAPAYCLSGFSAITVHVPSATIHGSTLSGAKRLTYDNETETIKLSGHISGRSATGKVHMQGPCGGTFTWTAHH